MRRGSSKNTPIYFFSSVTLGSGKSSIVSNLSVYLTNLDYKVALLDLDDAPSDKLQDCFPNNYEMEQYSDLSSIISAEDARFTKKFYFTETNLLSYFPAKSLKDPRALLTDIALRDFFLQLTNVFDIVIVNLSAGIGQAKTISDLLAKKHLWSGCNPASVIISSGEESSLVELDKFTQNNQILSYQAEENTYFVFNRVYNSIEEQNPDDKTLTTLEVRKLFTYPLSYIIPQLGDFSLLNNSDVPFVIQKSSQLHIYISGLYKLLSGSASLSYLLREANRYQSCISGNLLSRVYPYIEELQQRVSERLFINPDDVQIFLEQNENYFRIRVRLASVGQKLLGIRTDIPEYQPLKNISHRCPEQFETKNPKDRFTTIQNLDRDTNYSLSFKSIFTFDDSFYYKPESVLSKHIEITPVKSKFPSPILFSHRLIISEIPTLTNILGLKQYKKRYNLIDKQDEILTHGVKSFLIPTEFRFNFGLTSRFTTAYECEQSYHNVEIGILTEIKIPQRIEFIYSEIEEYFIYDIFARNKEFELTDDYSLKTNEPLYLANYESCQLSYCISQSDASEKCMYNWVTHKETSSIEYDISVASLAIAISSINIVQVQTVWKQQSPFSRIVSPKGYHFGELEFQKPSFDEYFAKEAKIIYKKPFLNIQQNLYEQNVSLCKNPGMESYFSKHKSPSKYKYRFLNNSSKARFRDKVFRHLPKVFRFEDILMDYRYSTLSPREDNQVYRVEQSISNTKKFKPDFTLSIEHKYMEPNLIVRRRSTYSKPIMYQLFVTRRLVAESRAVISYAEYKVSYNEIFPIIYFPQARFAYQFRNLQNIDWLGYKGRDPNTKLLKMAVPPIKAYWQQSSYETVNPQKRNRFNKHFEFNLSLIPEKLLISAPQKQKFLKDYLKYPSLPLIGIEPLTSMPFEDCTQLKTSDYKNNIEQIDTSINAPNIYTESMRFRQSNFKFYNCHNFVAQILDITNKVIQKMLFKEEAIIYCEYAYKPTLKYFTETRPPLLTKAFKLDNNFTDLTNKRSKFDFTIPFVGNGQEKLNLYRDNNQRLVSVCSKKEPELVHTQLIPSQKHVFKRLAYKLPRPSLVKSKFFIIPEKPDVILFNHLLWLYSNNVSRNKFEYRNKISFFDKTEKKESFKIIYDKIETPKQVNFHERKAIIYRMKINSIQRMYRVKTNYLKDLLELVKAKNKSGLAVLTRNNLASSLNIQKSD